MCIKENIFLFSFHIFTIEFPNYVIYDVRMSEVQMQWTQRRKKITCNKLYLGVIYLKINCCHPILFPFFVTWQKNSGVKLILVVALLLLLHFFFFSFVCLYFAFILSPVPCIFVVASSNRPHIDRYTFKFYKLQLTELKEALCCRRRERRRNSIRSRRVKRLFGVWWRLDFVSALQRDRVILIEWDIGEGGGVDALCIRYTIFG